MNADHLLQQRVKIVDPEDERNGQTGVIVLVYLDSGPYSEVGEDGNVATLSDTSVCFLLLMDKDAMFYEQLASDCQFHATRVY